MSDIDRTRMIPLYVCDQAVAACDAEIVKLKAEVTRLAHSRDHWLAKHDRAYAVAMHNERVILEMENRGR